MTGDQGNLPNYSSSLPHNLSHVIVGNGSSLPILGYGCTSLPAPFTKFLLSHVLHTPSIIKNLISVRKFTRDNLCSVEFDPCGFSVKGLATKTEIMKSNSEGDLYPFHVSTKNNPSAALIHSAPSTDVWHWRLGHPAHKS